MENSAQREFDERGFIVLKGALERAACERMVESLWRVLEETHSIQQDDRATWTVAQPRGLKIVRERNLLADLKNEAIVDTIDILLGAGNWIEPATWGGPLVTFPTKGPWALPSGCWHMDYPAKFDPGPRFALKILALLGDMKPGGGATLLCPGSHKHAHRLIRQAPNNNAGSSTDVRRKLAKEGIDLMKDAYEFIGKAGDVVLFHPWLFHNGSPNVRAKPRFMAEQNINTPAALKLYH